MPDETAAIAAAPPVETDAAPSAADVETTATETPTEDVEETPAEETEETATEQAETETDENAEEEQPKEEALEDFKGSAGARIRELCKLAPGLDKLLTQFPKAKDQIHSMARVVSAVRDQNLTVAELKEYRERLPNGLQDLNVIEQELGELGGIDSAFYGKRGDQLIKHMHEADPEAAIDLFRKVPQEWARLDPDSYSETFRTIIDSTIRRDRIAETALRGYNRAKAAGDQEAQNEFADLYNYLTGFGKKTDESPEARRLAEDKQKFQTDRQKAREEDGKNFNARFVTQSKDYQGKLIRDNPVFKKLPAAVSEPKKARMVEEIRGRIVAHLQRSRAFMSQIGPAFLAMDLPKCMEVTKQGWQAWLVTKHVRDVLAEETPGIIQGNNAANDVKRRAAARTGISSRPPARTQTPAKPGDRRKTANDFSMEQIMRGEADHLIK